VRTPQERIRIPEDKMDYYKDLAEMYVGDDVSPDFYGWVFPKYDHVAVGTGTVVNKPGIKQYQQVGLGAHQHACKGATPLCCRPHDRCGYLAVAAHGYQQAQSWQYMGCSACSARPCRTAPSCERGTPLRRRPATAAR
jgi:hypothetical protein